MGSRRPLSSMSPALYRASVSLRRAMRTVKWCLGREKYALVNRGAELPETVVSHRSILMRKLEGTDQLLQKNKITSLETATSLVSGVVINPGEVFSFWRLVGRPSAKRNFLPGLQLSLGRMVSMVGGGLCQFSNLLHWMVLHTPMEVTERHRHSFDPFPDYRRTVPFGTGATVFYNYMDLMFRNSTPFRFQIWAWVDEEYLQGEIRCDRVLPVSISIQERDHRFVRQEGKVYRENELWQIKTDPISLEVISEELLIKNHSEVRYDVSDLPGVTVD